MAGKAVEVSMHGQTITDAQITLTEAANIAPGRPSANCIWRWCRRGVRSRNGDRVRLQHMRIGGKIFTTARWLEEFGRALADADARYFDLCEAASHAAAAGPRRRRLRSPSAFEEQRRREIAEAERELEEAGL